jgi:zinc transport system substrate-binding protein
MEMTLNKTLGILFLLCLATACRTKPAETPVISVTIEPQRYFAEKIGGDRFTINVVVPAGQSPETYDPTPRQMMAIGESAAYLQIGYIGFEQAWMKSIRENNPGLAVFDLSEGMDLLETGEEEVHEQEEEGEHHHHHHGGVDPHIWNCIQGAGVIARNTLKALTALDEENKHYYEANYARLMEEVEATKDTIARLLRPVLSRAFIIYHPALTYFAEEFNLTQLCIETDGKEPSPAQLKELIDVARNYNTRIVFVQQEFDTKNAGVIAEETHCRLVSVNPLAYDWPAEMIRIAQALSEDE